MQELQRDLKDMADLFTHLSFFLFIGVVGFIGYKFFKDKSFSALIFGSKIDRTIGQIDLSENRVASKKVSIHVLENGRVAVEEANSAVLAFSVSGFTLSAEQAKTLSNLLKTAAE